MASGFTEPGGNLTSSGGSENSDGCFGMFKRSHPSTGVKEPLLPSSQRGTARSIQSVSPTSLEGDLRPPLISSQQSYSHNRPVQKWYHTFIPSSNIRYMKKHSSGILFAVMAVFSTCGKIVLLKSLTTNMYDYRWFLVQLLTFCSLVVYLAIVVVRWCRRPGSKKQKDPDEWENGRQPREPSPAGGAGTKPSRTSIGIKTSPISRTTGILGSGEKTVMKSTGAFSTVKNPKRLGLKFAIILGFLDCAHTFLSIIPLAVVPGPVAACLPYFAVAAGLGLDLLACGWDIPAPPMSCFSFLGGAMIVVGLWLFVMKGTFGSVDIASQTQAGLLMIVFGTIPLVLSNAVKRHVLHWRRVDLYSLNAQVLFFQLLFGFATCNLGMSLQYLGSDHTGDSSYSKMPANIQDGFSTLVGQKAGGDNEPLNASLIWQLVLLLICLAISKISAWEILETSYREAFVLQLNQVGVVLGIILMYIPAVRTNLWDKALGPDGPIQEYDLPGKYTPVIFGLILLWLGVFVVTRRADVPAVEMDEEALWFHDTEFDETMVLLKEPALDRDGKPHKPEPPHLPSVGKDDHSHGRRSFSKRLFRSSTEPPGELFKDLCLESGRKHTTDESSDGENVMDILQLRDNVTNSNPGEDKMMRVSSQQDMAGPGNDGNASTSGFNFGTTNAHPSMDDMTIFLKIARNRTTPPNRPLARARVNSGKGSRGS